MYKKNSIYSINKKYSDAIVYPFANGDEFRITREDNTAKKTVSIDDVSESALAVPGIDVVIKRQHKQAEERRKASDMVVQLKDKLTETQFRRLWKYEVEGLTIDEIGGQEGVDHQRISKSILAAKKKIKKIFPNA